MQFLVHSGREIFVTADRFAVTGELHGLLDEKIAITLLCTMRTLTAGRRKRKGTVVRSIANLARDRVR